AKPASTARSGSSASVTAASSRRRTSARTPTWARTWWISGRATDAPLLAGIGHPSVLHADLNDADDDARQDLHVDRHARAPDVEEEGDSRLVGIVQHLVREGVIPKEDVAVADPVFLVVDHHDRRRPAARLLRDTQAEVEAHDAAERPA